MITWLALIIQYVIMMHNRSTSITAVTIQFLSYFTILSNILVALCFTAWWLRSSSRSVAHPSFLTAVAVYILVVALIYNLVLRKISPPAGMNILPNELLHVVVPVLYIVFWVIAVPKGAVHFQQCWSWLLFPGCYLLYTILHGKASGFYPYPFTNITELGMSKVLGNCLWVALLFWLLSLLLIWIKSKVGSH